MSEENENVDLSKFVSKDDYEKSQNDLQAMIGRYKASETKMTELTSTIEELKGVKKETVEKTDQNQTLRQQVSELQAQMQKTNERADKLKKSAKRQAIITSMKKAGGDDTLVELAADSILATQGKSIIATENDNGGFTISQEDISGQMKPISEFVDEYMSTETGKKLVTPKSNPHIGNLNGAPQGEIIRVTGLQANKLTDDQLNSGLVEIID